MVTIGAILVAALGAAVTVGVAALRGENAMGMRGHAGGRMELHMGGRHHERGRMIAPEIGEAEKVSGLEAPDARQLMPPPPQWLMVAHGLLRAVAALVPLSLIVAGLAWVLHRTADAGLAPAK